ncbi:PLDc_N domain-containing protein [Halopseudomonas nanhaiensis]|uniref:PLD nuclease N-terminal domain-containing protein n=1 Tax=Halopseudomonas nanhaiensis TaxID=2830842 RepID=UPI001CBCD713|nr:PLD nuclease N-terminal domain-containing protein [Halopseudomonas nanhaiensis]UAW97760.1 PLDc_N domain-containing protein [Halopseudomonas nanhaiensis]
MEPVFLIAIAGLLIICIDLWLITSISKSGKSQQAKVGWALVVVLLPVIGWILWGRFGPRGMAQVPESPEHSKG